MKLVREIFPKWGEYYVAIVSLFSGNPKHKVIIFINSCKEDKITYTSLTYEDNKTYISNRLPYFELVEKINMTANEFIKN